MTQFHPIYKDLGGSGGARHLTHPFYEHFISRSSNYPVWCAEPVKKVDGKLKVAKSDIEKVPVHNETLDRPRKKRGKQIDFPQRQLVLFLQNFPAPGVYAQVYPGYRKDPPPTPSPEPFRSWQSVYKRPSIKEAGCFGRVR